MWDMVVVDVCEDEKCALSAGHRNRSQVREQPDGLHVIDAIMIFRDGVRPEWEDPLNASGGHFQFQVGGLCDDIVMLLRRKFAQWTHA